MRLILCVALMVVTFAATNARTEIYRWVDESGVTNFSNEPPDKPAPDNSPPISTGVFVSPTIRPESQDGIEPEITLFSTPRCIECRKARQYFEQHRIEFTELDVETSAEARRKLESLGGEAVPVILIGEEILKGFSAAAFERLYR